MPIVIICKIMKIGAMLEMELDDASETAAITVIIAVISLILPDLMLVTVVFVTVLEKAQWV